LFSIEDKQQEVIFLCTKQRLLYVRNLISHFKKN
jgi:hypothetical protein